MKLEHLAPYLPYGLKAELLDYKCDYIGKQFDEIIGIHEWSKNKDWCLLTAGGSKPSLDRIKPILRPLSDLTKEIVHNGETFVPADKVCPIDHYIGEEEKRKVHIMMIESWGAIGDFGSCYFETVTTLISMHFDVFGLIEKGEAVNINTI